ncbi:MAG TPA: FAD-binding oxidoreductase [Mycobacteriales bacterium]|nr:FAD-binding oxidoreductase [Mycobacteriales bacterium]
MTTLAEDLRALLGDHRVRDDVVERQAKARDCWPRLTLRDRAGEALPMPDVVVRPATTAEVSAVYRHAAAHGIPVTPYAGGSGVVGGAVATSGGICLDLSGITGLVAIDVISGTATFRAGTPGPVAEDAAAAHGFTIGHFPSSIMCSTVGGWVAARGAGQLSTRYGKAEDMVVALEAVLPTGEVWQTRAAPRTAAGPDMWRLLAGAEGTLGAITEVTLRLHPTPAERRFGGWLFPDLGAGIEALRQVMRTGARPAVLRLYDELDTSIVLGGQGLDVGPGALLVTAVEGDTRLVAAEEQILRDVCASARDVGAGPGEHWWAHRYAVSANLPRVLAGQLLGPFGVADTIEVSALWSALPAVYDAMKAAMAPHVAVVLAHVSHCYPEGASIYWTLATDAADETDALRRYDAAWSAAMQACLDAGGSIGHHHGVGVARAPWLAAEMGVGHDVLRRVKAALDPAGIANPGKLGL